MSDLVFPLSLVHSVKDVDNPQPRIGPSLSTYQDDTPACLDMSHACHMHVTFTCECDSLSSLVLLT